MAQKVHTERETEKIREEIIPMSSMRKIISERMSESWRTSPAVTFDIGIDMTALKGLKKNLENDGTKVSYTDLLVKVTSKALLEFPLLNCSVDGTSIIIKHYVNMGIAVALPNGLMVPVVKDTHEKGVAAISEEIRELAQKTRAGTLNLDSLSGGTFTITNLGMYGIETFSPIINQPEVAILGVNAIQDIVVAEEGGIVIKPIMKLSLSADHRVVDGAVSAQFLSTLKKYLETPTRESIF